MKSQFSGLLNLFSRKQTAVAAETTQVTGSDHLSQYIERRCSEVYGEEKLKQQLLYEHWAVKDAWHLRSEAMPLLFGLDPDTYKLNDASLAAEEAIKGLWTHARQCIEHDLLHVANKAQKAEDWQVAPLDIYQWAVISRLHVPEPLTAIMDFVGRTVKKSQQSPAHIPSSDGAQILSSFDEDRVKVLGMALAVLAAYPDQCRNTLAEIRAELIVGVCNEQFRRQGYQPKLGDGAMIDLIHKWLNVLQE